MHFFLPSGKKGSAMNGILTQKAIKEMDCGQCFAYILEDNDAFLTTEYKVMQSQKDNGLIPCVKMLFNGKTMLFYMPGNLKPLDSLIPYLDEHDQTQIVEDLLGNAIQVRDNGFLSWDNLVVNPSRIYVDKATGKTALVYLPVEKKTELDSVAFENEIRRTLSALLEKWEDGEAAQLRQRLENKMLSLEEVIPDNPPNRGGAVSSAAPSRLVLVARNTADRQELVIPHPPCVIGRHPQMANVAVGFSKAIGRRHCRIDFQNNQYSITDLESKNHTYVNGQRLTPNVSQSLRNGDSVRLADVDFRVEIM